MSHVRSLSADVFEVDLDMEEPAALSFEAGQWVSVPFGPKTVRAYSIASTPRSAARITLCADVVPGGLGSGWFRGLAAGTTVEFKAPFGGFVFDRADTRRPLFVAEEIGIVPIRAMLADLRETGDDRPATLVYAGGDAARMPYEAELAARARASPDFAYHRLVGAADAGAVAAAVATAAGASTDVVAYVSGGAQMIDRVRATLMARGLDRKSIRWEKFW